MAPKNKNTRPNERDKILNRKTYEVIWKNMVWTSAGPKDMDISDLLTALKGFGSMEILRFEKRGEFWGELGIYLDHEGHKNIVVYHLEVIGEKRRGVGRRALMLLREIFGAGEVHVEDPGGTIDVKGATHESVPFWIQMFKEGVIRSLESDILKLNEETTEKDLEEFLRRPRSN